MGSGLIIAGQRVQTPGLDVTNWLDLPVLRLRHLEDFVRRRAREWVRVIVLHTTKGLPARLGDEPQRILPGLGPSLGAGERCARYWSRDGRQAGAHLVVDQDGQVFQTADLLTEATYHCPGWNQPGIGVEIYQGAGGELYEGQLDATVRLCDAITRQEARDDEGREICIQRVIPHQYTGPIPRFVNHAADDVVGVIGHRDASNRRGPGDPGSAVMYRLGAAGYEPVNFGLGEDRELWRRRQREHGIGPGDGIPGPKTRAALKAKGFPHGLWVPRPGDDA